MRVSYKIESFKGIYILTREMPCGKIACVKMSYDKNLIYNMKMRLENDKSPERSDSQDRIVLHGS